MSNWYDKFIAFDTETTGFGSDARILELAILSYENGECVGRWTTLFYPDDVQWDNVKVAEALRINGLSEEELKGSPTFEDYKDHIYQLLSSTKNWCAHNLPFDVRMLAQEFARVGMELPTDCVPIDTMILDTQLNPYVKGRKLNEVADRWNVVLDDAHTAEADTECCAQIFLRICGSTDLDSAEELKRIVEKGRAAWDKKCAKYKR